MALGSMWLWGSFRVIRDKRMPEGTSSATHHRLKTAKVSKHFKSFLFTQKWCQGTTHIPWHEKLLAHCSFYHDQLLGPCKLPVGLTIAPAAGRAWHHSHGCWTSWHAECWFEESWGLPRRFQSQTVLRAALSLWGGSGLGLGMSELLIVLILGLDWRTPLHCNMVMSFCDHSRSSEYELVPIMLYADILIHNWGHHYRRL